MLVPPLAGTDVDAATTAEVMVRRLWVVRVGLLSWLGRPNLA